MKKWIGVLLLLHMVFLCACSSKIDKKVSEDASKSKLEQRRDIELNIVTTNKLMAGMIKDIVKDKHEVEYMFNNRQSELNFEFSEDALNNIAKKDLFIYMGIGFEPWVNEFLDKLSKHKVGAINASRGVKLVSYNKVVKYKDTVLKENPYYLMNTDNYKIAMGNIKNAVQDKDPKNRDFYEKNFSQILSSIDEYQKKLKNINEGMSDYTVIILEDELNYFMKYNNYKTEEVLREITNSKEVLESKIKDNKKLVLFYNDSNLLKEYEDVIKKYNINLVNIKLYNGEENYEKLMEFNMKSLLKFSDIKHKE